MKRLKKQTTRMPMPYAAGLGVGIAVILSAVMIGILTALISNESFSFDTGKIAIPVIQFLSTFVGCLIAGSVICDSKVAVSGVVCGVYYLLLIGVAGLVMNGLASNFWIGLLSSLIGCLGSIILCTRAKTRTRRGNRKRAYS